MSESKFTPGPWNLKPHGVFVGGPFVDYPNGSAQEQIGLATQAGFMVPGEKEANSVLMAAAPELLEALQELRDLMQGVIDGDYEPDSVTLQVADYAIAKATASPMGKE